MAFYLRKTNTLIVEPIRCGTTWMAHALRAAGIEFDQPETIGECCLRHAFPHNYAGEFDDIITPIRHPLTWLRSYYDFFSTRPPEVWQPNRFYAQKGFGASMPATFTQFVERAVTNRLAANYLETFVDESTIVMRQEVLRADFVGELVLLGYSPDIGAAMDAVAPINVTNPVSSWREVPDDLLAEYEDQMSGIVSMYYPEPCHADATSEPGEVLRSERPGCHTG